MGIKASIVIACQYQEPKLQIMQWNTVIMLNQVPTHMLNEA